jgi:hypothetical protein
MRPAATALALLALPILAACSSGGNGLMTGSILGAGAPAVPKVAASADGAKALAVNDPMARPIQVAWTSARAAKCGFYFDPAKLRAAYLAAEASVSAVDQMPKVEQAYDLTQQTVARSIAKQEDYCASETVAEIRRDLTRHLAGDYQPSAKKEEEGLLAGLVKNDGNLAEKPMDRNQIFFPSGGGHTSSPR